MTRVIMIHTRYRRITFFFARILISLIFWELFLPRIGLRGWARRTRSRRLTQIADRFRTLAIQMGGVMIKVGQFFSARVDIFPKEITSGLSGLQDEVPAEKFDAICSVAEAEFGRPLSEMYVSFDPLPVAAASLGQVHSASLEDGQQVVVKVQRPNMELIINTDMSALRTVGNWVRRYPPVSKRVDVPALLAEFDRILHEEINYIAEAENAEKFANNFQNQPGVRVPRVVTSHSTRRVLTLEDVRAIKITDYDEITQAGIDRGEVARRLINTYLKQIFEDGFFHADPHPGNLFVSPLTKPDPLEDNNIHEDQEDQQQVEQRQAEKPTSAAQKPRWQLTFVDFGMVGRVPPRMRAGMREMIIAIGTRDAARVVKSYQMLGVLLPTADLALLEQAEGEAFKRFWGKNMSELVHISPEEIGELAMQFRQLLYDLPFQIPEDLILLGRSLGILSGMCTGLDPSFNVWEAITPFAGRLIAEDAATGRENWVENLIILAQKFMELPRRTENVLAKVERGELAVRDPELSHQMQRVERATRKVGGTVVFAALLLAGVQLLLAGQVNGGWVLLVCSILVFVWILFGR